MSDVSVVIVNYRGAEQTLACVESVQRTAPGLVREVVIVDNDSGDGSVEFLRERLPDATVIANDRNAGFAAGVNLAVRHTSAPVIALLNPDTVVTDGALVSLVDRLEADAGLAATGPILTDADGSERLESYKALPSLWTFFVSACLPLGIPLVGTRRHPELNTPAAQRAGAPVARLCGSVMVIRRRAWDEVGPMDEGYFLYFEDVEWQARAADAGWRFAQVPQARVSHLVQHGEGRETWPTPYLESAFRYFEGRGRRRPAVCAVFVVAAAISLAALAVQGLLPARRAKARRMAAGYRELIGVALRATRGGPRLRT
jgi:N-acetylglucosaminyl-diphospho-decaprenol L-rhamnosyltransferase